MAKKKIEYKVGDVVIDNGDYAILGNINIVLKVYPNYDVKAMYIHAEDLTIGKLYQRDIIEKHDNSNDIILQYIIKTKNERYRTILKKILKKNLGNKDSSSF